MMTILGPCTIRSSLAPVEDSVSGANQAHTRIPTHTHAYTKRHRRERTETSEKEERKEKGDRVTWIILLQLLLLLPSKNLSLVILAKLVIVNISRVGQE